MSTAAQPEGTLGRPRKPRIELFWVWKRIDYKIDWRMVGVNNEIMCSSNQGFSKASDAKQAVLSVMRVCGNPDMQVAAGYVGMVTAHFKIVGPGPKPDAAGRIPKRVPQASFIMPPKAPS